VKAEGEGLKASRQTESAQQALRAAGPGLECAEACLTSNLPDSIPIRR
jgi:hypothetical protein